MQFDYYIPSHSSIADPFTPNDDSQIYASGFSRGSSFTYPHQDYRYILDRGELASRVCTSSLVDSPYDATGLGFAGNPSSNTTFTQAPEDISVYQQSPWDWIGADTPAGIAAPAPMYPSSAEPPYFGIKDAISQQPVARSPPSQLPTPAAMAVLLNPNSQSEGESSQSGYDIPGSAIVAHRASSSAVAIPTRTEEPAVTTQGVPESREKKHACTMCHKRFDRPSTLRKHLLVHTGEKAFVCDTCGRRFGVASNLNRHVKRCVLKPVNTPSPNSQGSPSAALEPSSSLVTSATSPASTNDNTSRSGRRTRRTTSPNNSSPMSNSPNDPSSLSSPASKGKSAGQKRRRRAPSPSQWVPATLQNFNLVSQDSYQITTVPLQPVRRNPPKEERDSWDENVGHSPYHPCGWNGILPGPGLGHGLGMSGKDARNASLGGKGGQMLGRVLVF